MKKQIEKALIDKAYATANLAACWALCPGEGEYTPTATANVAKARRVETN